MRPIINATFVSLDGVMNHMDKWHFSYVNDETAQITYDQLASCDAMLMGRKTYEIYAATWPTRDGAYPELINSMPKYVASTTLDSPTWQNTTVLKGDLAASVQALKDSPGTGILMHGFGPVAKSLARAGLLDELHLWLNPAFAGVGDPRGSALESWPEHRPPAPRDSYAQQRCRRGLLRIPGGKMIARMWRGLLRTEKLAEYVDIVERTGMSGYCSRPGNAAAQLLTR